MDKIELRNFEETDLNKIKQWYTQKNEWQLWDAPWDRVEYAEEKQKNNRSNRTNNKPCFEYEIIYNGEHVGWISAYYMTDDFKYNGLFKTNKIAIGIDIPEESVRRKGVGTRAIQKYLEYFKNLGYEKIYLQTWSGNIRMVGLAKKVGFREINRFEKIRHVRGKLYDALTFEISL